MTRYHFLPFLAVFAIHCGSGDEFGIAQSDAAADSAPDSESDVTDLGDAPADSAFNDAIVDSPSDVTSLEGAPPDVGPLVDADVDADFDADVDADFDADVDASDAEADSEDGCVPVDETCNGMDDDCDGEIDNPGAVGCVALYFDGDDDGYGVGDPSCLCLPQGDYTAVHSGDCNDGNDAIYPGAAERWNGGVDDNCDGVVDTEGSLSCVDFRLDHDGDGYGHLSSKKCLCGPEGEYDALDATDCNDDDGAVHPGATEACNGKDDNCDGQADVEGSQGCLEYHLDHDGDGYGHKTDKRCLCATAGEYDVLDATDCNDSDIGVNPGAAEACNGKDDNCDGQTDVEGSQGCTEYHLDHDGDGFGHKTNKRCLCSAAGEYDVLDATDCYDDNADARPNSVVWSTVHRGDGSFDFNCDAVESLRFSNFGTCGGSLCQSTSGWLGSVPQCGQNGTFAGNCPSCVASTKSASCR